MNVLTPTENTELECVLIHSCTMGGRTGDQGALKIPADYFQDTINETQSQLNNMENQHEQTELQKRISSLDVPRDRAHGQREIKEVRVLQEEDSPRLQEIKE